MGQQAEVNIGLVGHVDHGKTTITKALTGKWTDTHSEEVKRGITIRLGYADAVIRYCDCGTYTVQEKCPKCGKPAKAKRTVAFVDAPGHETLMAVMISGSAIMDGAMLVIAANEPCPQPQTEEHLMALEMMGIKNIIIIQNKVDVVSREEAVKHHDQIKAFVKGTVAENAPIIPVAAHHGINIDAICKAIEEVVPTPQRDLTKPARMMVARSFDVNKPGTEIAKLLGGVIGGSLVQGQLKLGDRIEIRPGISKGEKWVPVVTEVTGLNTVGKKVESAGPGGLIGVATKLDPALTKTDKLVGNIAGKEGTLPQVYNELTLDVKLMDRVIGVEKPEPIKLNEPLVINVGTATTIGFLQSMKPFTLKLKRPVCGDKGWKAAISRRINNRWRLVGYGTIA
jgi:translation initiation factor 2 subunit 3